MVKNIGKFLLGGIAVAALGISALFGVRYFRMQSDTEYQQMREAQKIMGEWERLYREDTYGGTTPQETLSLFIEALKKGDTDLAAKYFVPDEREETITYLNDLKKDNLVICGALRYAPQSTSDGTAARLAHFLKAPFINVTNVDGLYTDNPATNKNARFLPSQTFKKF